MAVNLFIYILLVVVPTTCLGFDQVDLEIFDLYEEVNGTFYELLGVQKDASLSEVRRAYRKLSLVLHPDKNEAANAEEQFRQLVAVYEILKDKEKREKYNEVLKNGLPDWRQPIYYYRKYRKMGNLEVSIIVSVILTIGHFLTWWGAYLEKKFEMEEILAPVRKRREKKKAKGKLNDGQDDEDVSTEKVLERDLGYRKPTFWDLLPFVLYRLIKNFIVSIPKRVRIEMRKRKEEEERQLREVAEEIQRQALLAEKQARAKRPKPAKKMRDASEFENEEEFRIIGNENLEDKSLERPSAVKVAEWTDEDYAALAKAMAKFPGGTPGRWERIAHELGRRADEVTKKVREMKTALVTKENQGGNDQIVTKKRQAVQVSDTLITKAIDNEIYKTNIITNTDLYQSQYDIPDNYDEGLNDSDQSEEEFVIVPKKVKVKTRPVEEESKTEINEESGKEQKETKEVDSWSQMQQKCLEQAILQFPKSTSDRWTCIARAVPEKNKEQCIARYKLLAEHIKQKKQSKTS